MIQKPLDDGDLDALLTYIHERRNFDFRGYKRASVSRRILKRMTAVGVEEYQAYVDVLEANPGEFAELFDTILINVTAFLRDRDAWDALGERVLPDLVRTKTNDDPIRVWSAGCASGEEAYSLAVVLAETVGEERFRRQVKIYATDADANALVEARHGRYEARDLVNAFGEPRASRFFEMEEGCGVFRPDLRRSLIFGRHDLVQDPPISKIDLLVCRNTLMYFSSDVQRHVLSSFHFAVNRGGYLFLGKSEALVTGTMLFETVDLRRHIFRKDGSREDNAYLTSQLANRGLAPGTAATLRVGERLLEQSPIAQLVVDVEARVLHANLTARRLFALGSADTNMVLRNGEVRVHRDLQPMLQQVVREGRVLTIPDAARSGKADGEREYDMMLVPLQEAGGIGVLLVDVSRYRILREDLERAQRELESAYEELQSAVEELETTNEELQSTNEELETTNEELHSTNEELETMNEELQSTNEELETINNELRERTTELDELNAFLQSILAGLRSAVIVLGPEMEVRAWNRRAEDLWGLRAEEVEGQHFLNLDIGFPVESVGPVIRSSLAGRSDGTQITKQAVNRRGRTITCTATISPLVVERAVRGVIVLMDAMDGQKSDRSAG